MSKIGRYNLELQEQANKLGFSTTEQAISAGWSESSLARLRLADASGEYEKAHKAWLKEKSSILADLESANNTIKRTIDFVKKGEV